MAYKSLQCLVFLQKERSFCLANTYSTVFQLAKLVNLRTEHSSDEPFNAHCCPLHPYFPHNFPRNSTRLALSWCEIGVAGLLILNEPVDVVLGAAVGRCHLEHIRYAQQCLLGLLVRNNLADGQEMLSLRSTVAFASINYLQYSKVLKDAVHHVSLGQMFQFLNKIDHVFTHGRSLNAVNETWTLQPRVFRFDFFNNLFTEWANFCWACYHYVFIAFVSVRGGDKRIVSVVFDSCSAGLRYSLTGDGVEGSSLVGHVRVQISPTLH